MKIGIYISGIGSFLLLLVGLLGLLAEFPNSSNLLLAGGLIMIFVYIPLMLFFKYRRDQDIDRMINSHKGRKNEQIKLHAPDEKPRGWSMNDSPFRERKSGLTWGGGTISHSKATRGSRKSFLGKN